MSLRTTQGTEITNPDSITETKALDVSPVSLICESGLKKRERGTKQRDGQAAGRRAERADSGGKVNRRQGKKTERGRAMGSKQEGRAESVERLKVASRAHAVN